MDTEIMPTITFHFEGKAQVISANAGQSVLDVALDHDIPLPHNCGGSCACTTCHVVVRSGMAALSEMEEDEADRLDTAEGLTITSRLGCQAKILDNVVVEIPAQTQPFRTAEPH